LTLNFDGSPYKCTESQFDVKFWCVLNRRAYSDVKFRWRLRHKMFIQHNHIFDVKFWYVPDRIPSIMCLNFFTPPTAHLPRSYQIAMQNLDDTLSHEMFVRCLFWRIFQFEGIRPNKMCTRENNYIFNFTLKPPNRELKTRQN